MHLHTRRTHQTNFKRYTTKYITVAFYIMRNKDRNLELLKTIKQVTYRETRRASAFAKAIHKTESNRIIPSNF